MWIACRSGNLDTSNQGQSEKINQDGEKIEYPIPEGVFVELSGKRIAYKMKTNPGEQNSRWL